MTNLPIPEGFSPDGPIHQHVAPRLVEAGFEPGYPLVAFADFDVLEVIHALSCSQLMPERPLLRLRARLPDGSPTGEFRPTPMRLKEASRHWGGLGRTYWYLGGQLDRPMDARWYLNRLPVDYYTMHVVVFNTEQAYMQFIPVGSDKLGPICDGLRWASKPFRIPPPS